MEITYYGTRGSIPVPGKDTVNYGGNTACIKIEVDNTLIILDAGSGLWKLGLDLMNTEFAKGKGTAHLFFSHLHWDHINGFPFFKPAYIKNNLFVFYSVKNPLYNIEKALSDQQQHINFPVKIEEMASSREFKNMPVGRAIKCGPAVISNYKLNHPGEAFSYKIEADRKKLVYATDNEHADTLDEGLVNFAHGADVLIYDTMFTPEEYKARIGWGHSTYIEGIKLAKAAKVKQLHLFHYNPEHTDKEIAEIEQAAKKLFPNTFAAKEGWSFDLS